LYNNGEALGKMNDTVRQTVLFLAAIGIITTGISWFLFRPPRTIRKTIVLVLVLACLLAGVLLALAGIYNRRQYLCEFCGCEGEMVFRDGRSIWLTIRDTEASAWIARAGCPPHKHIWTSCDPGGRRVWPVEIYRSRGRLGQDGAHRVLRIFQYLYMSKDHRIDEVIYRELKE
jgi:hypothetical protein